MATLAGCEMGLKLSGVPLAASGVAVALDYLAAHAAAPNLRAAG
jgi:alanine-glyoxylate transaminase / serine-glyoxylate transaminase / serine-pyruvate transaminase